MPRWALLVLLAMTSLTPGCGLLSRATHVVAWRSTEAVDEHREQCRNRQWAEQAWNSIASRCPYPHASTDYADGFKDGFAEFLYHGVDTPPTMPPRKYRKLEYQSGQGFRAIQDWYSGYAAGTRSAQTNGFRRLVTGPHAPDTPPLPVSPAVGPPYLGSGYTPAQWFQPIPQP